MGTYKIFFPLIERSVFRFDDYHATFRMSLDRLIPTRRRLLIQKWDLEIGPLGIALAAFFLFSNLLDYEDVEHFVTHDAFQLFLQINIRILSGAINRGQ